MIKQAIADLRQRMRTDFRLGLYLVFGVIAVAVLLPLGGVRLYQGALAHATLDLVFVAIILATSAYALRGGDLGRAGLILAVLLALGGCLVVRISEAGIYWLHTILMASAFMVGTRVGAGLFLGTIVFLVVEREALVRAGQPLAVLSSLLVSGAFAVSFARFASQRRAHLEQMATVDPLTGAENRRALEVELAIVIAGFRRDARPVALALIDLDHFKSVNDRFGHEEGDRVLQDFVRLVQASVRRTDRLYRYGGEEFVLLMPATDELGLELAMSHLREQVRNGLQVRGEPVTMSIGGAILRVGERRDEWFTRADDALYRAKDRGRNRLEIDGIA
ncbi:MAG: diguanylate cyclase [Silanimonas sp.]